MKTLEELGITPGPWRISQLETKTRGLDILPYRESLIIASVALPAYMDQGFRRANARLIAATPALYEALRKAILQIEHMGGDGLACGGDAAIKLAGGE